GKVEERLPIFSFYHPQIHFNLIVRLLNDRFGIQVRGGRACAGTYGHYLLEVSYEKSREITQLINSGDLSKKPGWVRWSLHPTSTNEEIMFFTDSLRAIIKNIDTWEKDYIYNPRKNEFYHVKQTETQAEYLKKWYTI
ncbi:MAG: aminotransferase class V-fold PLP-dependent enzyme, partial [Bacteroidales bacterium]|nr:aminotransferase class V-fold PLP-dependent enzyme [Bacteroidales bacterium]